MECPKEGLINYRDYVNCKSPIDANDHATNETLKEINNMLLNFFSNEGTIFKSNYDRVIRGLKLPSGSVTKGDISDQLKQIY